MLDSFQEWFQRELYPIPIFYAGLVVMLAIHFFASKVRVPWFVSFLLLLVTILGFLIMPFEQDLKFVHVIAFTVAYGVMLFIVLCEMLMAGLSRYLTRKRGEKWVKELDYVYLAMGSLGILATINRIDFLQGRLESKMDLFLPMALATAVVIRFIKTRAEIARWNTAD